MGIKQMRGHKWNSHATLTPRSSKRGYLHGSGEFSKWSHSLKSPTPKSPARACGSPAERSHPSPGPTGGAAQVPLRGLWAPGPVHPAGVHVRGGAPAGT